MEGQEGSELQKRLNQIMKMPLADSERRTIRWRFPLPESALDKEQNHPYNLFVVEHYLNRRDFWILKFIKNWDRVCVSCLRSLVINPEMSRFHTIDELLPFRRL